MLNRSGGSEYICLNWMYLQFSSVQSLSRVRLFATPWIAARQASVSITNSWSLPKLMSTELVMPSNHLILCCPLLLLPSIFSKIRVFWNESALCIRWPKYWSFSFNINPSNDHRGLIYFRMDWLDLLAVQGTLKSLLQHQSSKASILWRFSLLHGSSHSSIHDNWKNHSFDYMDFSKTLICPMLIFSSLLSLLTWFSSGKHCLEFLKVYKV